MSSRYNVMCWTEGYNHCEHQEQRRGEDVRSQAVAAMDRQSDGLLNRRPMQLELPGSSMQGRVNLSLHRRRGAAVPGVPRCAGGGGGGAALRPSPVPWLHAAPAGALSGACIAPPRHRSAACRPQLCHLGFSGCFACVTIPTRNHMGNKFLCFFPSLHSCVHYISKNSYELLRESAGTRTFLPGIQSLKDEKTSKKRQCRFVRGHLGQVFKELVRMDRRRSAATAPRADRLSTGRRCRTWMAAPLFLRPEMAATDRTMLQMRRRPSP